MLFVQRHFPLIINMCRLSKPYPEMRPSGASSLHCAYLVNISPILVLPLTSLVNIKPAVEVNSKLTFAKEASFLDNN